MSQNTIHIQGLFAIFALVACMSACSQSGVSEQDLKIANAETLPSKMNNLQGKPRPIKANEPDAVPEAIAQSLMQQLANWPKTGEELSNALRLCAGRLAIEMLKDKSRCDAEETGEPDFECIKKHHYGEKSLGQALTADQIDLNGDNQKDYIMADRYYCQDLSANQSSVYFVMLSQPDKSYKLAYADWASYAMHVVKAGEQTILVERAPKTYGLYTRIYKLDQDKLVARACIFQDGNKVENCPLR